MKTYQFKFRPAHFALFFLIALLTISSQDLYGQNRNKKVWEFRNSTGQAANDLHMDLRAGTVPTNIVRDAGGIGRVNGIFADYPENGSPTRHDYDNGTVANGGSITIQFKDRTRPHRWYWTNNGRRIGNIENLGSPDLIALVPFNELDDVLTVDATGTGHSTGDIADLAVTNGNDYSVKVELDRGFIPSEGQYQSYVISESISEVIRPGETRNIRLNGYCADIGVPAVPDGESLPPLTDWVTTDDIGTLPQPGWRPPSGSGWESNPVSNEPGNTTVVYPGTDVPFPYQIDSRKHPASFAPFALAGLIAIENSYDELKDNGTLTTPLSESPEKERETVIQQTFWRYTAALTGNDYKIDQMRENVIYQFEESANIKFSKAPSEIQNNLNEGVENLWDSFNLVGEEAKVFLGDD